jgi:Bacterial PH domain
LKGDFIAGLDKKSEKGATLRLTDEKIQLQWKSIVTGRDLGLEEIRYSDITNIELKKDLLLGILEIRYPGGKIEIDVKKNQGDMFISNAKKRIQESNKTQKLELKSSR